MAPHHSLKRLIAITIALTSTCFSTSLDAALVLASPFTDHMVLQRDMLVPIWGSATPSSHVQVEFAGQKKSVQADREGNWSIHLDALSASSDSRVIHVTANRDQAAIELTDVVVGEVWICSGQSNMQMTLGSVPNIERLESTPGRIRSFQVENTIALEEQNHCNGEWTVNRPDSAVAAAFAHYLEDYADVPIGIILSSWGSSSIEAWMPRDMTEKLPHFKKIMAMFDADSVLRGRLETAQEKGPPWDKNMNYYLRHQPNVLYNAMMKPLAPYACRGIVWYQGERNTGAINEMPEQPWTSRVSGMQLYDDVLQQWMQRYRQEWEQPELHFLVVMLPGFGKLLDAGPEETHESPDAQSWAWMRESQLKALELPHTGVANTIDLGHLTNIHPKDKLPIGQRLAKLAARNTLGQDIVAQGPTIDSVEQRSHNLLVTFKHAEGLKTTDGKAPTGFWITDDSGIWHLAQSQIQGEAVALYSPDVKRPLYVRYAFAGMPTVNLVNSSDLPALPFRTDHFPPK